MQELWLLVSVVTLIKCSTKPRIQISFPKFSLIKSTISATNVYAGIDYYHVIWEYNILTITVL